MQCARELYLGRSYNRNEVLIDDEADYTSFTQFTQKQSMATLLRRSIYLYV